MDKRTEKPEQQNSVQAWQVLLGIVAALLFAAMLEYPHEKLLIPCSEFLHYLQAGQVAEVNVARNGVEGKLKKALPDGRTQFANLRVDPDIARELDKHGVKYSAAVENTWLSGFLAWLLPTFLLWGSGPMPYGA